MHIRSPENSITSYDLHVVFHEGQVEEAQDLYQRFLNFLNEGQIEHQKRRFFSEPVGPWPTPMWQCVLSASDTLHQSLGLCTAWFMLNRGPFSVMIHPNTLQEGDYGGAYEDHDQNHLWLGDPLELRLEIFNERKA